MRMHDLIKHDFGDVDDALNQTKELSVILLSA